MTPHHDDLWDVLDLYAGTGSSTQAWVDRGHRRWTVEWGREFKADLTADIGTLTVDDLRDLTGWLPTRRPRRRMVWASIPCTTFSVASMGHHWTGGRRAYIPATDEARDALDLVEHTLDLIRGLAPDAWLVENPRGMLHRIPQMQGVPYRTVWYCTYGDDRAKPTNLFGEPPAGWIPRPQCRNGGWGREVDDDGMVWALARDGSRCHQEAKRGARTGTQGRANAKERSRVPYALGESLALAAEGRPEGLTLGQAAMF
jgi:hypothetical protein